MSAHLKTPAYAQSFTGVRFPFFVQRSRWPFYSSWNLSKPGSATGRRPQISVGYKRSEITSSHYFCRSPISVKKSLSASCVASKHISPCPSRHSRLVQRDPMWVRFLTLWFMMTPECLITICEGLGSLLSSTTLKLMIRWTNDRLLMRKYSKSISQEMRHLNQSCSHIRGSFVILTQLSWTSDSCLMTVLVP